MQEITVSRLFQKETFMQIKLVKAHKETVVGSVVDCDEATGKQLIADQIAIEFTEAIQAKEKETAIKSFSVITKREVKNMSKEIEFKALTDKVRNDEPNYVGKAFQKLAGKAVTGMSEGTAADGGALLATAVAEVHGIAMAGSKVYARCAKITLPDGTNSIKVPVDTSDPWIKANAPVPTNPAEGAQKTATKLAFAPRTLTLAKTVLYIPTTDELLSDAAMLDGYIRQYAASKLAGVLDYEILTGGGGGFAAIVGDTGYCATQSISSTPTLAEMQGMVSKVDPRLLDGSEFFISIALWNAMVGAFGTSANINNQLIDIAGKKLLGHAVNVMPQLNAEVIFGNLSQYTVAVPRVNDVIKVSESIRFDYDETVYRLVSRNAGAITWASRTSADSIGVGAFVEKA
jgi:HK97 family phage major capsid protein